MLMPDPRSLREKAEAATPGPWRATYLPRFEEARVVDHVGNTLALCDGRVFLGESERAAYIAAWHPTIALAALDVIEAAEARHANDHPLEEGLVMGCPLCAALAAWREAL